MARFPDEIFSCFARTSRELVMNERIVNFDGAPNCFDKVFLVLEIVCAGGFGKR